MSEPESFAERQARAAQSAYSLGECVTVTPGVQEMSGEEIEVLMGLHAEKQVLDLEFVYGQVKELARATATLAGQMLNFVQRLERMEQSLAELERYLPAIKETYIGSIAAPSNFPTGFPHAVMPPIYDGGDDGGQ